LKENVIVGRLIPAGTGLAYHKARKVQRMMDDAERRAIAKPKPLNWHLTRLTTPVRTLPQNKSAAIKR
jgi:hypothetical protein